LLQLLEVWRCCWLCCRLFIGNGEFGGGTALFFTTHPVETVSFWSDTVHFLGAGAIVVRAISTLQFGVLQKTSLFHQASFGTDAICFGVYVWDRYL